MDELHASLTAELVARRMTVPVTMDSGGEGDGGGQLAGKQLGERHAIAGSSRGGAGNGVASARQPPE
jgi:hypothetical protein